MSLSVLSSFSLVLLNSSSVGALGPLRRVTCGKWTCRPTGARSVMSCQFQPVSDMTAELPPTTPPRAATWAASTPPEIAGMRSSESALNATSARSAALRSPTSVVSTVPRTESISTRPRVVSGWTKPG